MCLMKYSWASKCIKSCLLIINRIIGTTTKQTLFHIRRLYPSAFPATIFHEITLRSDLLYQIELIYAPG